MIPCEFVQVAGVIKIRVNDASVVFARTYKYDRLSPEMEIVGIPRVERQSLRCGAACSRYNGDEKNQRLRSQAGSVSLSPLEWDSWLIVSDDGFFKPVA
jgi:hypothetical protein